MLLPMGRCGGGRMRWVVRKAQGQLLPSNRPSTKRHSSSCSNESTKPAVKPAADQTSRAAGYSQYTLTRSANQPNVIEPTAKAMANTDSNWP